MENSKIRTSYARANSLLSSYPYSHLVVHFRFFYTHADYISFPSELANRFSKLTNRPAHSVIRHGSGESILFPRKIDCFSAVSVSLFRPRGVRVFYAGTIDGARDAFVFLLSPFLFPSLIPFLRLLFLTTSHNPNGIFSNI